MQTAGSIPIAGLATEASQCSHEHWLSCSIVTVICQVVEFLNVSPNTVGIVIHTVFLACWAAVGQLMHQLKQS